MEVKKATPQLDVAGGGARGGQPSSPRSTPHAGSRLFVGGVPESIPVSSLRRHFEQWGEVKARSFLFALPALLCCSDSLPAASLFHQEVYFPPDDGGARRTFCFVQFGSVAAAAAAVVQSDRVVNGMALGTLEMAAQNPRDEPFGRQTRGLARTDSGGWARTDLGGLARTDSGGLARTSSGGLARTNSGGEQLPLFYQAGPTLLDPAMMAAFGMPGMGMSHLAAPWGGMMAMPQMAAMGLMGMGLGLGMGPFAQPQNGAMFAPMAFANGGMPGMSLGMSMPPLPGHDGACDGRGSAGRYGPARGQGGGQHQGRGQGRGRGRSYPY